MLAVVSCTCGSAEGLARAVLKEGGDKHFLTTPIYKGKKEFERFLDDMKAAYPGSRAIDDGLYALSQYVSPKSSYVVIVGTDGVNFEFQDVKDGTIRSRLDGETLVAAYKDL